MPSATRITAVRSGAPRGGNRGSDRSGGTSCPPRLWTEQTSPSPPSVSFSMIASLGTLVRRRLHGMGGAQMVGFGPKQAWLAIGRNGTDVAPDEIMAALGGRDLGAVDWRAGIDLAYLTDDRIVITPPIAGAGGRPWTLVAGRAFFAAGGAPDVTALSASLDADVQFFATLRVAEAHNWERAVGGRLVRAFRFVGERGQVTTWYGEPEAAELAVGLPASYDTERGPDGQPDIIVGEPDVMRMAAAWSVDPSSLDGHPAGGRLRVA